MRMRVCVDARLVTHSGIGTSIRAALTTLSQTPTYELILLCCKDDREMLKKYASRLIEMKSRIYSLREQLEYVFKIPPCDLFWAPHFNVPLLPMRAKRRLTTIHDVYHLAHFASLTLSQKVYAKLIYNAAFLLSDQVITDSEFSRKEILKWGTLRPKKLGVVPCVFDFSPPSGELVKGNFLLFVGNVKPHKNLVRLVKAYDKVRPSQPLYIVGRRDHFVTADSQLFSEVEKNPFLKENVHFLGYVGEEKLKELYAQASLLVFPSTYEGFGYPPLEAMACGCPVVASKVASIPEVCCNAVEYIDPFSIDSIAEGIARLLKDQNRREELITRGKELVDKKRKEKSRIREVIDACCSST